MSTQPIHTDEQTTDPQVRARLLAACDTDAEMPITTNYGNPWSYGNGLVRPWHSYYRDRIERAARSGFAEYRARKGL